MEMSFLCVLAGLAVMVRNSAANTITAIPGGIVYGKVGGTAEFPWTYPDAITAKRWYKGSDASTTPIMDLNTGTGIIVYDTGYSATRIEPMSEANMGMRLLNLVTGDAGDYTARVVSTANPPTVTATLQLLSASEETSFKNGVTFTVTQDGTEQPGTDKCPTGDFTVKVEFAVYPDASSSTCDFKGNAVPASSAHTYGITSAQTGDVITMTGELPGSGITKTLTCTVEEGGGGGCEIGCIMGIVIGALCLCGIIGVAVYCCKRSKKDELKPTGRPRTDEQISINM